MVTWMLLRVTQLDVEMLDSRPIKEEAIDLFRYRTTYSVGRGMNCNLRMLSSLVSRMHGELRLLDNTVFVKDLRSSNGTFVNKHRILPDRELSLHEGDRIGFGSDTVIGPESFVFTLIKSDSVSCQLVTSQINALLRPVECISLSSDDDDNDKRQETDSCQPALQVPPVMPQECSWSPERMGSSSDALTHRKRHLPNDCGIPCKMPLNSECVRSRITSTSCSQSSVETSATSLAKPFISDPRQPIVEIDVSTPEFLGKFSRSQTPLAAPVIPSAMFVACRPVVMPAVLPVAASVSSHPVTVTPPVMGECHQPGATTYSSHSVTDSKQVCAMKHSRPAVVMGHSQSVPVPKPAGEVEHLQPATFVRRSHSVMDCKLVDRVEPPQPAVESCLSHSAPVSKPVSVTRHSQAATNLKPVHGMEPSQNFSPCCSHSVPVPVLAAGMMEYSQPAMDIGTSHSVTNPKPENGVVTPQAAVVTGLSNLVPVPVQTGVMESSRSAVDTCSSHSVEDLKSVDRVESYQATVVTCLSVPVPTDVMECSSPAAEMCSSNSLTESKPPCGVDSSQRTVVMSSVPVVTAKECSSAAVTLSSVASRCPPSVVAARACPPCVVVLTKSANIDMQLSSPSVKVVHNCSSQAAPVKISSAAASSSVPAGLTPTNVSPPPAEVLPTSAAISLPVAAVSSLPPTTPSPDVEECSLTESRDALHTAALIPTSSSSTCQLTSHDIVPTDDDDMMEEKPVLVKLEFPKNVFAEDEIITISDDEAYPSSQLFEETETNEAEVANNRAVLDDESDSYDQYLFMDLIGDINDLRPSVMDNMVLNDENIEDERIEAELTCGVVGGEVSKDQSSTSGKVEKTFPEKAQKERRRRRKPLKTLKRESAVEKEVQLKTKNERQEKLKALCKKMKGVSLEREKGPPCKELEEFFEKRSRKNKSPVKVGPTNVKVTDKNRSAMLTEAICASVDGPKGRSRTSTSSKAKNAKQDVKKIIESKNMVHCSTPTELKPHVKNLNGLQNPGLQSKRIPKLSFKDLAKASTSTAGCSTSMTSPLLSPVFSSPSTLVMHLPNESCVPAVAQERQKKSVRFREGSQLEQVHNIPKLTREERPAVPPYSSAFRRESSANLGDVIQEICSWKTSWFRCHDKGMVLPPTIDPKSILPMLDFFTTHEDYTKIVERLMFCELWEMISEESKEKKSFCYIAVKSLTKVRRQGLQLMDINCHTLIQSHQPYVASQLRQGHLVAVELILEKSNDSISFSQSLSQSGSGRRFCEIIGYVEQAHFQPVTAHNPPAGPLCKVVPKADQMLNLVVRTWYRNFDLRLQDAMRLRPLCYIRPMLRSFRAVRELKNSPLCSLILNPKKEHFSRPPITEELYAQGSLNECQQEAVLEIAQVCRGSGHNICLIQGPPGTGKSHVIVNLVVQLLFGNGRRMEHKTRILLCAQSNAAVDEVVRRLMAIRRMLDNRSRMKLVRFGQLETMHPEVQSCSVQNIARRNLNDEVRQSGANSAQRSVDDNIRMLSQDLEALQRIPHLSPEDVHRKAYLISRISVLKSTQRESAYHREMCQAEKAERLRVFSCAEIVCTTIGSCCSPEMEDFCRRDESTMRYTCCIIDEATKCWEPETLVPLLLKVNNLVLVGDPAQLQGIVRSSLAKKLGFEKSLFGRISSCVSTLRPSPVKFLSLQYRMCPAISHWPNKYFYHGRLRDATTDHRPCLLKPYIVLALGYVQGLVRENAEEAEFVVQLALTVRDEVDASFSVGIITPYNQQKQAITQLLQRRGRHRELSVDVIDSVQGQERDVVLVSMVRTDGVGFLSNESRLNVALTRARHSLIVCGNFTSLKGVKAWDDLLRDARERHLFLKVSEKHANSRVYLKSLIMRENP